MMRHVRAAFTLVFLGALSTGAVAQDTPPPIGSAPGDAVVVPAEPLDGPEDLDAQDGAGLLPSFEVEDDTGVLGAAEEDVAPVAPAAVYERPIEEGLGFGTVRTDSPRQTLETFLRLRADLERLLRLYREDGEARFVEEIDLKIEQFNTLLDMSHVPPASRREQGIVVILQLLDIFERVPLPALEEIPVANVDKVDATYRIPNTPLRLLRMEEGPREGEFLFSSQTLVSAPRFYRTVAYLPLDEGRHILSWQRTWRQLTGPMIPAFISNSMPSRLQAPWFDTPAWKVLFVGLTLLVVGSFLFLANRVLRRAVQQGALRYVARLVTPVSFVVAAVLLDDFFVTQLNLTGAFAAVLRLTFVLLLTVSIAWVWWAGIIALFDMIVASPRVKEGSLNASFLQLLARILGVIGVVVLLAVGASALGFPVFSVLAGLGIGGLAVALAIRPTLENLIGGVILLTDKPVRVGDFCEFGEFTGTVEKVGIRSTQVRKLDRTIITIPNAKLADIEIINYARADKMMVHEFIGLRYETTTDQLRYVLVKFREMFHAHPRIDSDTVRVRLNNFGASALNVEVRVYALTREWNDYFAIREDILMRLISIVHASGTGFAFPSQTLYMANDHGLDADNSNAAEREVAEWRQRGRLPFPRLAQQRIAELAGTLDYPPQGSVERTAVEGWSPVAASDESGMPGTHVELLSVPEELVEADKQKTVQAGH